MSQERLLHTTCFGQERAKEKINQQYLQQYREIDEIRFGIYVYPLQKPIKAVSKSGSETKFPYLFFADDLPGICGKGTTIDDAKQNWMYEFHRKFQDIYYKIDWERTEEENKLYKIFVEIVDIQGYRKRTPVSFEQTGKIIENKNIPSNKREIEWLDESRDIVDCADCPKELLQYKAGEYFRADMLREYQTDKLLEISSIIPTSYRDYTDKEIEVFVASLPTTKNLPPSAIWK
ncbi:MAG: hypothetical protein LBU34_17620 [Planctomycetaceae bacterium]|jgi:hypothetical protein|nr:hypothetical protein [Planctomycetaceae bacterium]